MKMEELLACYSWEGSAPDPVFSRYTRYTATTRANIDDFGDRSRYTEPLQALHPR